MAIPFCSCANYYTFVSDFINSKQFYKMKFKAEIDVMPLKSLLDPQGKAVSASMGNVGLSEINNVRIGKHITLEIEADNKDIAKQKAELACTKLLCNQIMESFELTVVEL
tara:strand:- start:108 stop:437 length:330 start_codon:yes stop_codon:yes gene_type:complete